MPKVPALHPMDYRETAAAPTCPARVTGPGIHSWTPFAGVSVHDSHHVAVGVSVHGPAAGPVPGPVHFGVVGDVGDGDGYSGVAVVVATVGYAAGYDGLAVP